MKKLNKETPFWDDFWNGILLIVIGILVGIGLSVYISVIHWNTKNTVFTVSRVVDNDTVELSTGDKVKLLGINTPESTTKKECFGKEASAKIKELVEGKDVTLEIDITNKDSFGRLLRYIWIDDVMLNKYLIKEGYAFADIYPKNTKYKIEFEQAEEEAHLYNKGLWNECNYK